MISLFLCAVSVSAAVLFGRPGSGRDDGGRLRRSARGGDVPGSAAMSVRLRPVLSLPTLLDLVAEVLASGASPPRAVAAVAECLERVQDPTAVHLLRLADRLRGISPSPLPSAYGIRPAPGGPTPTDAFSPPGPAGTEPVRAVDALATALALSVATGAGPVALIRAAAQDQRRRSRTARTRAAHRLGVLVLLPTGLCLLPAFVLLTVVPLIIDLVIR